MQDSKKLTGSEIQRLTYNWIGVDGGYLVGFSYAEHDRFWMMVADIDASTGSIGTTRECFMDTLGAVSELDQAEALREILRRYERPEEVDESNPKFRSEKLEQEIKSWIVRLETGEIVIPVTLESASEVVGRALSDAETLLSTMGPQSAVDRVHTALHGYLHSMCDSEEIVIEVKRPTMNRLFKSLRDEHPALQGIGARAEDINKMLGSFATILDALNPIRNQASVAHPTSDLIGEAEAMLAINVVRTMLAYLEQRQRGLLT